jgi:Flp pilus assembly protein TadG
MGLRTPRARRFGERHRCESGASALEFALLAPIVFTLVLGVLTGGLALNSKQQLNHAAREGARYAATKPIGDNHSVWLADVRSTARMAAQSAGVDDGDICVAYVGPNGTVSTRGNAPCIPGDNLGTAGRVQVTAQTTTPLIFFVWNDPSAVLSGRAIARHEPSSMPG